MTQCPAHPAGSQVIRGSVIISPTCAKSVESTTTDAGGTETDDDFLDSGRITLDRIEGEES